MEGNGVTLAVLGTKMDSQQKYLKEFRAETNAELKEIKEGQSKTNKRVTILETEKDVKEKLKNKYAKKAEFNWWKFLTIAILVISGLTYVSGILE